MSKQYSPTLPGEMLLEMYIKPLRLTIIKASAQIGLSRATVQGIVNGRIRITEKTADALAKRFKTSSELWLNLQKNYDAYHQNKGAV